MGVELALGAGSCRVLAYVEREAYACEVLASRMEKGDVDPAPIWTDVTTFDARPFRGLVDIVSGGFPCQDISVVLEDLASLGYDAEWGTLRASDVGATHHRDRMFILAYRDCGGSPRLGQPRVREGQREHGQVEIGGDDSDGRGGEALADPSCVGRGQGRAESDTQGTAEPRESGADDLADDDGGGWRQVRSESEPELTGSQELAPGCAGSEQSVSDTNCSRLERHWGSDRVRAEVSRTAGDGFEWPPVPKDASWCAVVAERPDLEPSVRRVADGLAYRVDRLRLTGNGVVPAQAAHAFRELLRRALTFLK